MKSSANREPSSCTAKIRALLRTPRFRELVRYCLVGGATTLVSYGTFALTVYALHWQEDAGDTLSIILAVLFAYVTNKIFVFRTHCATRRAFFAEMGAFFASRAVSMAAEKGCNSLMFHVLDVEPMVAKVLVSVGIIVLNYFLSRYFAFRKRA